MQLVKEKNKTELLGEVSISNLVDYINFLINFYQSLFVKTDDWLPKQERRFFIASVIISNKGYRYVDSEAKAIYKEIFNLRRQSDIRGYLRSLESKGFLSSDIKSKKILVEEFFIFNLETQSLKFDVKINFKDGEVK